MHFDTTLNVTWLLLGALALGNVIRRALRPDAETRRAPKWLHVVGVGLIVAALFPYISATDDVVRMERFHTQDKDHHSGKRAPNDDLIRLYESMDSPLICRTCEIAFTLFFVAMAVAPVRLISARSVPFAAGRSPPSVFLPA